MKQKWINLEMANSADIVFNSVEDYGATISLGEESVFGGHAVELEQWLKIQYKRNGRSSAMGEKFVEINDYIAELTQIDWLKSCGSNSEQYHVIHSVFEAYDDWNEETFAVWLPHSEKLEAKAQEIMGDEWIEEVFDAVAEALYNLLWEKWTAFIERCDLWEECGLENEMLNMIIRDVAWVYIERVLEMPDFFTQLLEIYKEGFFPCSWDGNYPKGRAVVL